MWAHRSVPTSDPIGPLELRTAAVRAGVHRVHAGDDGGPDVPRASHVAEKQHAPALGPEGIGGHPRAAGEAVVAQAPQVRRVGLGPALAGEKAGGRAVHLRAGVGLEAVSSPLRATNGESPADPNAVAPATTAIAATAAGAVLPTRPMARPWSSTARLGHAGASLDGP